MNRLLFLTTIVTTFITNTLDAISDCDIYKKNVMSIMADIPGWCNDEKASLIFDVIKNEKCQLCVEIGVFSGKSLFPIAKALQYNGSGSVFGIDAWNANEATRGFKTSDPNFDWWNSLNYEYFYNFTSQLISNHKLEQYCTLLHQPSQYALNLFDNETIDFIHFDGNHNEDYASQDVISFFPKVKDGGYILLNDPNWFSMKIALVFLLERAELITPFAPNATFILFKKDSKKLAISQNLMRS